MVDQLYKNMDNTKNTNDEQNAMMDQLKAMNA